MRLLPVGTQRWGYVFTMLATLVLFNVSSCSLQAEPFTTIVASGNPSNRVDIAILGDGYTANEIGKYQSDVDNVVQSLFLQEPFKEYQNYFNVHRIDVTSLESGADHPESTPPVFKNTAFDATYNCAGIQRLICVSESKVLTVVSSTLTPAQRDLIIVIVNDPAYGGSGGSVAVSSTDPQAIELVLHESGHTFGLLADEYDSSPPACDTSVEPSEPNATKQTVRASIKWNAWIDAGTAIPTTTTTPSVPGLYQGAKYCPDGLYRPTYNSKMRNLGQPFDQINSEQLIKRIYNFVSPIDSSLPTATNVSLGSGQFQDFSTQTPQPLTHALNVTWLVDGITQGTGPFYRLQGSTLSAGPHTVTLVVSDPTVMVRNDPLQILRETQNWTVNMFVYPSGDVNGDFQVTGSDSLLINQVIANLQSNTSPLFAAAGYDNGDVNQTATVTSGDSLLINQVMAGLRSLVVTKVQPLTRTNKNTATAVTIYGVGFPTNAITGARIGSPVNLTLSNVVAVSREQITAIVPGGGGPGTGTVSVTAFPSNNVVSFGKFINP